jgi:hypothetical protein
VYDQVITDPDALILHMVQNSSLYSMRTVCILRDELPKRRNLYNARGALSISLAT